MRSAVPTPRVIWGVGLNYRDHAAETGRPLPDVPTLFMKSPRAVIGHGDTIVVPPHVMQPDYEGELAIVIGRTARDVSEVDAPSVVAGVTVAHDVSSRDHLCERLTRVRYHCPTPGNADAGQTRSQA